MGYNGNKWLFWAFQNLNAHRRNVTKFHTIRSNDCCETEWASSEEKDRNTFKNRKYQSVRNNSNNNKKKPNKNIKFLNCFGELISIYYILATSILTGIIECNQDIIRQSMLWAGCLVHDSNSLFTHLENVITHRTSIVNNKHQRQGWFEAVVTNRFIRYLYMW